MRRAFAALLLGGSVTAAGCGFGLADDTGKPIPGQYWRWVCADGNPPQGDAGCLPVDAAASDADAGVPSDGPMSDR
jgi:hypothetical protein